MNISIPTVKKVIALAKESDDAYWCYSRKFFPDGTIVLGQNMHEDSPEYLEYEEKSNMLYSFVRNLDYDQLLDIEALMLMGRDNDDGEGEDNDFRGWRDYVARTYPSSKGASEAAEYITSKGPLAEYLENALKIIG